jgi:AcrR family transcriptional regulator
MTSKAPRADAVRNRARVLEVAAEVFATEGLSVPVQEIASRAGVGTGTVSRHFPTKLDLFRAVLLAKMEVLCRQADVLAEEQDAGTALLELFATVVRAGATHQGLAEALVGAGFDLDEIAAQEGFDVSGKIRELLEQAQRDGTIRADITQADIKALMNGCLIRGGTAEQLAPIIAVVCDGLRAKPSALGQS